MRTRLKLKPGQDGTKRLLEKYGDRLVCVRYRYDREKRKRYKTVELIVEERRWEPKAKPLRADSLVELRIGLHEGDLRQRVKRAGGRWNPERKLWEIRYDRVLQLGLSERIRRRAI